MKPLFIFHSNSKKEDDKHAITLGELKQVVDQAIRELGPDIKCQMSYDSTAGYDSIGSIYSETLWDGEDFFVLSCANKNDYLDDIQRKAKRLFGIK